MFLGGESWGEEEKRSIRHSPDDGVSTHVIMYDDFLGVIIDSGGGFVVLPGCVSVDGWLGGIGECVV